jgi:N-acetylated-alpha-linked acidic dipeptidase
MHIARTVLLSLGPVLAITAAAIGQAPGLRGFTDDGVSAARQREAEFRTIPDSRRLEEYMQAIAGEPHVAGQPGSRRVAEYALEKFRSWGLDATIETFEALMPWPTERVVELVSPAPLRLSLEEPVLPDDPDSSDLNGTPTFNAYSADGDVTGEVVYVNYGMPADYERLEQLGISVKGKIVLARYGAGWRGSTARSAASSTRTRATTGISRATSIRAAHSGRSSACSAAA